MKSAKTAVSAFRRADVQRVTRRFTRMVMYFFFYFWCKLVTQVLTRVYGLLETQQRHGRGGRNYCHEPGAGGLGAPRAEEVRA